jgi:glucose-6-phosphate dehydrogenase assembly protein OpcA
MSPTEQRMIALERANEKRSRAAHLRRRLAGERGALRAVLLDPPEEFAQVAIIDVVRLAYSKRSAKSLARLGRLAVRDRVNLMMPLGEASLRTREWTADHAEWHWHSHNGGMRRRVAVLDEA